MGRGVRPVSVAERRARLAVRHHLAPGERAGTVTDAVADIVGLHGTDPASVYLSAWARTARGSRPAIEHALYEERSLVRMLGMRRTVFVVPVTLGPVIQAACTDQIAERMRRRLARQVEESGIAADGASWLRKVGRPRRARWPSGAPRPARNWPGTSRGCGRRSPTPRTRVTAGR